MSKLPVNEPRVICYLFLSAAKTRQLRTSLGALSPRRTFVRLRSSALAVETAVAGAPLPKPFVNLHSAQKLKNPL